MAKKKKKTSLAEKGGGGNSSSKDRVEVNRSRFRELERAPKIKGRDWVKGREGRISGGGR